MDTGQVVQWMVVLGAVLTSAVRTEMIAKQNKQDIRDLKSTMNSQHASLKEDLSGQISKLFDKTDSTITDISALKVSNNRAVEDIKSLSKKVYA